MSTPTPSASILSAREVSLRRGKSTVLRDITLDVSPGEVLALVGPNGAGKSTLLGALAGSLPFDGTITLTGTNLTALSRREQARIRAVLPQTHSVGFGFTCREVIEMGRFAWHDTPHRANDDDAIAAAIDECAVAPFLPRRFTELSGGERARVALARVLAQATPLILLDEPTAAMDLHFQESVMQIVAARARAGTAVVVVVHDLSLAAAWADRVAVIADGHLVADDGPHAALTEDLLSRVYEIPIVVRNLDGQLIIGPDRRF